MGASLPVIADEVELLRSLAPLDRARVLELGCGKAEFARRLLDRAPVAAIAALEVDAVQHERNLAAPPRAGLEFHYGGAQAIPFGDASFDGVLMMKSLHHVPVEHMDGALGEVRRVLKPGGWLYVSEPVFAGDFNEVLRLFHDEEAVRQRALEALERAAHARVLENVERREFLAPREFRDYDDFVEKIVRVTHTDHAYSDEVAAEVRTRLERHQSPTGVRFLQPMRVDFMRRPPA
jgi:ubiquinone/menaquinone biosynthesis C-methylase UbiE